ncbi:hypothetical protein MNBD_GAMMA22-2435 [hydrothermal vent metagenome]|uniref:Uncharacterized protein n=1 Tax=hydrothermal vent metagenome TaxID=652676 RepID=A0A3B0ZM47_9ZZZZ
MMNKLRSIIDLRLQSISQFFIQTLLFSALALSAPQIFAVTTMDKNFDHYNTEFPLDGVHKRTKCDACHVRGVFEGTPKTCDSCHGSTSKIANSRMSTSHVRVTATCDSCHSEKDWKLINMNHNSVSTNCTSCHSASRTSASKQRGKNSGHIRSSNQCSDCHRSFTTWSSASLDHGSITKGCASCHNGSTSGGQKSASHIPVLQNVCENCHGATASPVISTWVSRQKMDHASVTPTCLTCHSSSRTNQAKQRGKNVGHIQSSDLCADCHRGFSTWKGASTDHGTITSGCASCHNGSTSGAKKGLNHIPVTINLCENCHGTNSNPVLTDWKTKQKMDHGSVDTNCVVCHSADRINAAKQRGKHAAHIPSSNLCADCHKKFTTWKGATSDHSLISTGCFSCHNGTTSGLQKGGGHMVSLNVCEACHSGTMPAKPAATVWSTNMSYDHANSVFPSSHRKRYTAGGCLRCHSTNSQFAIGSAPGMSLYPDCAGCHAQTFIDDQNEHQSGDTYITHKECNIGCHGNGREHSTSSF